MEVIRVPADPGQARTFLHCLSPDLIYVRDGFLAYETYWFLVLLLLLSTVPNPSWQLLSAKHCSTGCEACWQYLPHDCVAFTAYWRALMYPHSIWCLLDTLRSSDINFLFRPWIVITTREGKIKFSVGYDSGDTTYSDRDHENFHGGNGPWI